MASDKPDRVDRRLLRPTLDELINKRLEELGNASCRVRLNDLMEEEWYLLTERSCIRDNRSLPNERDALNAFDAIKHSIQEDHGNREQLLRDPTRFREMTATEVWNQLKRLPIKHWIVICSGLIGLVVAAFSAGVWFSKL